MRKQKATSMRLTEESIRLKKLLSQKLGINGTSVIELAIRELAEKHQIGKDNQHAETCHDV